MTKAEQKKMEKAARSMFITQAFGCVLDAICDSSQNARGNPQIRVNMKSGNRYIFFHRYLQDFNIKAIKKMNANFVSKLAFRGARTSLYNFDTKNR